MAIFINSSSCFLRIKNVFDHCSSQTRKLISCLSQAIDSTRVDEWWSDTLLDIFNETSKRISCTFYISKALLTWAHFSFPHVGSWLLWRKAQSLANLTTKKTNDWVPLLPLYFGFRWEMNMAVLLKPFFRLCETVENPLVVLRKEGLNPP